MNEGCKILLVDDEPNILMSLDFLMRKQGFQVFVARNGSEALHIFHTEHLDLIILDIMMPDIDGYEVCQVIKSHDPACKVVFLSAKTKEADIEKGYAVGADLYLIKPFSNKNLVHRITELLL